MRILAVSCALAMLSGTAMAEDMPVVRDEPLTQEEAAAAQRERMRDAQQMLIDLGLLDGVADGAYGPRTAAALKLFQSRNSLIASGELNDVTLAALREQAKVAGNAREIQQRLIDLGYLRGKADGIFGERSVNALKLFQTLAGLEPTGNVDEATREALFAADARTVPKRLTGGDKGDAVVALQERLVQLGFLSGKADGNYGKATAAAVRRFQKHLLAQGVDANLGIEANGEATSATQALLFDPEYSTYVSDIAPGDQSDEALRVERRLKLLGYMDAEADDTFDDYAASAVEAFRTASGLAAGNTVDKAVVDALFAADALQAEHFVPHDIAKGDRGQAVLAVKEALARSGMMIQMPDTRYDDALVRAIERVRGYLEAREDPNAALFKSGEALDTAAQAYITGEWLSVPVEGDGEDAIIRIQRRLNALYYLDRLAADGKLGDKTTEALTAFQAENGLPATGEADDATRKALFSDDAVYKQLPYRVEVSIDDQRVYVYERNEAGEYEQTHTFICSTGLGNSTPRGIFLDGYPVNYWHHFSKYDCWAKYSFEVEGNIMFHSVIFSENDESTLRESSLYGLGQKASHGCIRLKVADARWLFQHCKRGTLAIIIY